MTHTKNSRTHTLFNTQRKQKANPSCIGVSTIAWRSHGKEDQKSVNFFSSAPDFPKRKITANHKIVDPSTKVFGVRALRA